MQHVDVKVHRPVATIVLDRASARNALSHGLLDDLQMALSDVHQEKRVRAVVVTGSGDHFCAGADLRLLREIASLEMHESLPKLRDYWGKITETFEQLLRFPKPVIAAVDGAAVGAGFGLALAADLVVASRRSSFSAPAVRKGLVGGGTAALLSFRLGGAVASRMLLGGEPIDAEEAHRIGLCEPPVESAQIWVAASELAKRFEAAPAEAIQATKRTLNESIGEQLLTQLSAGAAGSATSCTTEAALEGMTSFLESREPIWP